jgi:predicted dehydrogenase
VICEKPAGVYTKQVLEMNECAKNHDVKFGIMMNQRTNCIYRMMREIVQSGELGEIRRTNWLITDWYRSQAYYDSGDWRATWSGEGGGVLLNQCPHNLDLWQWICGMPKTVFAHMHYGKWHDIEVEDDVTACVEYSNGATGSFSMIGGSAKSERNIHIVGTKGEIKGTFEDSRYVVRTMAPSTKSGYTETVYDLNETGDKIGATGGHGGGDKMLVLDFIDYLNGHEPSVSCATLEDSIISHRAVFKAEEARKNETIIKISI